MRAEGHTNIEKLLSVSSDALAANPPSSGTLLDAFSQGPELLRMLQHRNGFYAFESALHVFPLTSDTSAEINLEQWNSQTLWRCEYEDLAEDLLFFAEDVFQDQFCLSYEGIVRFQSETGERTHLTDSIEDWAGLILSDYRNQSRWPLLHQWQELNGPLLLGQRLMPKTPFFLGGKYELGNFWAGDAVEGMRLNADIAMQTRNLPNGAQVRLIVGPKPEMT
jgi:hypothetical protein